ncbi:MAG TPA: phosphomannomutase/phosphoglucomutase [Candidatus Hydrogenedentes bacterium]|nr:phosphomannomutase/phosphoglucomutase [Candidatus Hydrogenedentota bacterium]
MRWDIETRVPHNSYDYFEKTLITDNGFREYDVRWIIGKEINPNGFVVLGKAYGTMMQEVLKESVIVVGHDFRSYSQDLSRSLIVGLLSTGVRVIDLGLTLTPMVYYGQHHFNCKAGIQVTASHNENGWTGLKIANGLSSTLGPEGILAFKEFVKGGKFISGQGTYETFDGIYEFYKKDALRGAKLSKPIKVVLAAGNGTAGRYAPQVLRELGCDVVELDCTPDWEFKRHNPNPEDLSFLHDISRVTKENGADLGIGIDGDGDRVGVVDGLGREVFSDKLGLLIARWICQDHPGRSIVMDVKSTGLFHDDAVLRATNTTPVLWKTGHSYIKAKVAELNALAGFEKSGHWFFNEPYGRGYDDAMVSAVHLLRMLDAVGKPLAALVDELPKTFQSPTLGCYCADDVKYKVVDDATAMYQADKDKGVKIAGLAIKDIVTVNGVRFILEDDSWGLVRASSNKPSLVIVAESRGDEDVLYDIVEHIQARLAATGNVGEYDQSLPPRPKK